MKKPMKKFKRYQEGGDIEEAKAKERGLAMSNKEKPVGFFERIRMGNIDEPGTEAYNRFGAGRGRERGESVSVNQPMPSKPVAPAMPAVPAASSRPLSDPMYSDYGSNTGMGAAGTSETIKPTVATKPVVPAAPSKKPSASFTPPAQRTNPNFSNEGRTKPAPLVSQIPGSGPGPAATNPIDSTEGSRTLENLLTAAAIGIPAIRFGKKLFQGKKALDATKRLERPKTVAGKDFIARDYDGPAKATPKGSPKKKLGYSKDSDITDVTAKKHGGKVKKYASGGMVSSASRRADGIAIKGKTRGKIC